MNKPKLEEKKLSSKELRRINRRAFFTTSMASLAGLGGLIGLVTAQSDRGMLAPLRAANSTLDSFWNKIFNQKSKLPPVDANGKPVRINGDVGLMSEVDAASYRLSIMDLDKNEPIEVTLDQIKKMPTVSESFEFKCIEGWSRPVSCRGVRFSDFMQALNVGQGARFAGMTSIDGGYYVSWDRKSLLHSQTILCYEMNGSPLDPENGAPLRILASVKYGVKQIKQLGRIEFTNQLPADYWAEQGYDDYLGL